MKNLALLFLLGTILLCSSCFVSFKNPPLNSQRVSDNLLGKWQAADKESDVFEIVPDSNLQTILKLTDGDDPAEKVLFSAAFVELNNRSFLSLKLLNEKGGDTFLIAKYEIKHDKMRVWLLDESRISKMIEQKQLNGELKSSGEISISASSKEINELLESPESDELFEDLGTFKKQ
jgi:hypothetical protein